MEMRERLIKNTYYRVLNIYYWEVIKFTMSFLTAKGKKEVILNVHEVETHP